MQLNRQTRLVGDLLFIVWALAHDVELCCCNGQITYIGNCLTCSSQKMTTSCSFREAILALEKQQDEEEDDEIRLFAAAKKRMLKLRKEKEAQLFK